MRGGFDILIFCNKGWNPFGPHWFTLVEARFDSLCAPLCASVDTRHYCGLSYIMPYILYLSYIMAAPLTEPKLCGIDIGLKVILSGIKYKSWIRSDIEVAIGHRICDTNTDDQTVFYPSVSFHSVLILKSSHFSHLWKMPTKTFGKTLVNIAKGPKSMPMVEGDDPNVLDSSHYWKPIWPSPSTLATSFRYFKRIYDTTPLETK